jgi:hypothetical protein
MKQEYVISKGAAVQTGLGLGSSGIAIVRNHYQDTSCEEIAGWKKISVLWNNL